MGTIRIAGRDVPLLAREATGAQIKAAAGLPAGRVLVKQDEDRNVIVPDHAPIRFADGDQFTHHAAHSKG